MFGFIKRGGNKSAWAVAIINVIVFFLMAKIPPLFIDVFIQLGADLPAFTRFMIVFHLYTPFISGLSLLGALFVQLNISQTGWILIGVASSSVFATIVLTVFAMYLPIFSMGQVVAG